MSRSQPRVLDPGPELADLSRLAEKHGIHVPFFAGPGIELDTLTLWSILDHAHLAMLKDAVQGGRDNPLRFECENKPYTIEVLLNRSKHPWLLLDTLPHDRYDA